ncbi:hypothetical protein K431DRAFT_281076 [Polychaeton citri CBS 116435]|uniref:Zinc metalloprotease n=1 Tax=Polychaeton citri CBS 116435 TaxID=1314669 RepID=A0A9P4QIW4_9PEZI|nr:hypothetical protein K431DRAFT_281076 [Polychaeton citri CBS 116435]
MRKAPRQQKHRPVTSFTTTFFLCVIGLALSWVSSSTTARWRQHLGQLFHRTIMPAAMQSQPQRQSHFKTVQKLKLDYAPISITQYESTRTGMRVVAVDQKGPKVNGYFALATEIHDDSGAPHTLEHLCFMGSKSYRYKGLLDKLATRAYSTTNAWTATEHTAYTLDTAGWDGFAQILPIYLEHVIVPTLTDEGCYTEVFHIDPTGQDTGVVYSEMQGVQNTGEELMELGARRLLYPEGSGYRYETGGMMEALRVLTADRIRQFHKEMYQPKNLCLVLTGEVNHTELLNILDTFEETILDDVPKLEDPFRRPWVDSEQTPALTKTIVENVKFPEEDESMGEIMVAFLGPGINEHVDVAAYSILEIYLCGSSISVLENVLVEREQLCSSIESSSDNRAELAIWFLLSSVETDRLREVYERLISLLKEMASKKLDMQYMHDCITRFRRQIKLQCEGAGGFFATPIIEDHLFGRRDGRDLKTLETMEELDVLQAWSEDQWREFMRKWLADAHHVAVLGVPSQEMSEKITKDEKERVEAQKKRLGEEGLKKLAEKLEQAKKENDKPIPDSLLEQFPVPSTDSIHFIDTTTARAGNAKEMGKLDNSIQELIDQDDQDSSLFIHFEHIPSNFVRIKIEICTSAVPVELKPLVSLYFMNLFTSPVMRNGQRVEFEDVVVELQRETVAYGIDFAQSHPEIIAISFQCEPETYESVIGWTRTVLFDAIHDPVRLQASLTKILASLPAEKRDGEEVMYSAKAMTELTRESTLRSCTVLSKALYLKRTRRMLKNDPDTVIAKFKQVCDALHRPENFRVFVAADIKKLSKPVSAWKALTKEGAASKPLEPLDQYRDKMNDVGKHPGSANFIIPMATIDSSFAVLAGQGPRGYQHEDVPALMVAQAYMDAVEGPLWVSCRGSGLAYGTSFSRNANAGTISFRIYRSPDTFKAYKAAKEQVEGYASGNLPFDKFALEGAISEIVLGQANAQPSMGSAADVSFVNQVLKGVDKDWDKQVLAKVRAVTPEHIKRVMTKYMVPIFQAGKANLYVACAQIMQDGLVERFEKEGWKPEVRTSDSFQDDYGLEAPEGGDSSDEEDEEESGSEDDSEGEDTPGSDEDE